MVAAWLLALAPEIGFAVDITVHVACMHLTRRAGASIVASTLCGFIATALMTLFNLDQTTLMDQVADCIVSLMTYLALAFGYWGFVNLNITSLRVRMLRELLRDNQGISDAVLSASYTEEEFLQRRLTRLKAGRQLRYSNGRYFLESHTLLLIARFLNFLRVLVLPEHARPDSGA